jgi:hypothetical protein
MGIAAGVAAVGVAGAVGSSVMANQGAQAQKGAADQANVLAQEKYNQIAAMEQPYQAVGQTGLNALTSGINDGSLTAQFDPNSLANNAGYNFEMQQGQQATQNSQAAMGLGTSGAALKAAAQYAQGLASTDIGTYGNLFYQGLQNKQNMLLNTANIGQTATNALAGANQNTTQMQTSDINAAGNATAAGDTAIGNSLTNASNSAQGGIALEQLYGGKK